MATAVKGDVGKVMFHNAAGTEADVASTRSWSLSITKDTMETTNQGDTSKTFIGGLISGEGSCELLYDTAGNSDYQSFIDDVLVTEDAGDAQFELFLDTSGTKKVSFSGIVTGTSLSATTGELETVSVSFISSGAITNAA